MDRPAGGHLPRTSPALHLLGLEWSLQLCPAGLSEHELLIPSPASPRLPCNMVDPLRSPQLGGLPMQTGNLGTLRSLPVAHIFAPAARVSSALPQESSWSPNSSTSPAPAQVPATPSLSPVAALSSCSVSQLLPTPHSASIFHPQAPRITF